MVSKLDEAFSFQQKAMGLRAQRQQVLASNIANADTPNYKARDFDFSSALKEALSGRGASDLKLANTSPRHLPGAAGSTVRLQYRQETQSSVDGNTVDMDVERAQFAENAVQFEASMTFVSGRFKTLLAAVQG